MGNYSTTSFPSNRWVNSDALSNLDDAIQSIDAAIRYVFGFSTNALTSPFDIADDGAIVVQTSIAIGTSNAMIDVVDEIPTTAGANEDQKLAHVDAIRTYLVTQHLPGTQINLDTANFDNNLSGADTTVQKAMETLDELDLDNVFHYDSDGEFSSLANESIAALDHIVFEDASDSFAKAYTTVQDFASVVSTVSHNHDDRYYTETELDNGQLDNRYYTETEADLRFLNTAGDTATGEMTFRNTVYMSTGAYEYVRFGYTNPYMYLDLMKEVQGILRIYDGHGANQHRIVSSGNAYLCEQSGNVYIGGSKINYSLVSGNDTNTDVTGTELEELSDGSSTTLHKHDHGGQDGLGDDDHTQYLLRSEWKQNGFVDYGNEVDFAWVDGTRTLTISPSVTSFQYYYDGVLYAETGSLAATITDTEGDWLFYIGSGGAASLSTIHNPSYAQVEDAIRNECLVAYVYWDAANSDGRLLMETHGAWMSPETHHYLHETRGAQYIYGFAIGDITTDQNGTSDAHAQFSITAGEFYDEDLGHDLLARSSTDTWEAFYVDGSGYVRWTDCEATFPVVAIGGVIAYNNAGTLTAVSSNKYCLYHVYATNVHTDSGGDYYPIVVPGTAEYNLKSEAQDAALSEIQLIDWGEWPTEELIPLWSVIYHHGAAMTNGVEAAIQSTDGGGDAVDWRFSATSGSEHTVNDHGALSGLSDDDHAQYLLASAATDRATFATNWTDLTDTGDTTLHGHDVTGLTNWGGPYLPLTGGTLSGGVTLENNIYLAGENAGGTGYNILGVDGSNVTQVGSLLLSTNIRGADPYLEYNSSDLAFVSDLSGYLPLTAGSGSPLTGDLYIYDGTVQSSMKSGSSRITLGWRSSALNVVSEVNFGNGRPVFITGTLAPLSVASEDFVLESDLDYYLPLTAGSGKSLTGDLYVDTSGSSNLYLRHSGSSFNYLFLTDVAAGTGKVGYVTSSGTDANLYLDPLPSGNDRANVHMFRSSSTTDQVALILYQGDATATVQHKFNAKTGDVDLCQQGGDLTVGGTVVSLDGHSHVEADITDLDHTDTDAIHDNVAGEINAVSSVSTMTQWDLFLVEDNSDSWNKKKAYLCNINNHSDPIGPGNYFYVSNDSGGAMAKGNICYISGDASGVPRITKADADAASTGTGLLVMCLGAIANGSDGWCMAAGTVNGFSSLTAGAVQYLSTTAGGRTQTAPSGSGDIVRVIGHAISSTEIYFNPSNSWVEVA